jgi:hypothetical protein
VELSRKIKEGYEPVHRNYSPKFSYIENGEADNVEA